METKQTTASVVTLAGHTIVSIDTSGEDLEKVTIYLNKGKLFDDFPEFALDPGWRDCPRCPTKQVTLNYCAMCGVEVPWGASPSDAGKGH